MQFRSSIASSVQCVICRHRDVLSRDRLSLSRHVSRVSVKPLTFDILASRRSNHQSIYHILLP